MTVDAGHVGLVFSLMRRPNYGLTNRFEQITPEFVATFIPDFLNFTIHYVDGHQEPATSRQRDVVWYKECELVGYLSYAIDTEQSAWSKKHHINPATPSLTNPYKTKQWIFYVPKHLDIEICWHKRISAMYDICQEIVAES